MCRTSPHVDLCKGILAYTYISHALWSLGLVDTCPQYDVDAALSAWGAVEVQLEKPRASSAVVEMHPPKRIPAMPASSALVVVDECDDGPQGSAQQAVEDEKAGPCSPSNDVQPNALEEASAQNEIPPTSQPPDGLPEASQEPQCPALLQEAAAEDDSAGMDLIEKAVSLQEGLPSQGCQAPLEAPEAQQCLVAACSRDTLDPNEDTQVAVRTLHPANAEDVEKPAPAKESQEPNAPEDLTATKSRGLSLAPGPEPLSMRARLYETEVRMHASTGQYWKDVHACMYIYVCISRMLGFFIHHGKVYIIL